tara:strand:- start:1003 stop:1497 length:495 start_codon:yes stop_codon:yes gene_type:complete
MALRNAAWHSVEPGQIVTFTYKSKNETRGYKRTILLLNPDFRYRKKSTGRIKRFVVGLVLDTAITRPLTETKVNKLFNLTGGLEVEEGTLAANLPDTMSRAQTKKLYNRLKSVVNQYKNYRTFDRRECLKRRVYLEVNYDNIPKSTLNEFAEDMLKVNNSMFED